MSADRLLLAAQLAAMLAIVGLAVTVADQAPAAVGDLAPEFSVVTDEGRTITRDHFAGKLLMVNFWATWCPPCVHEMPALSEFAGRLRPRGLTVLAISFDDEEGPYRSFLRQLQPAFATTRAGGRGLAASFGTFRIPETYLIDRNGRVVRKYVNSQDWMNPAILDDVQALLQ